MSRLPPLRQLILLTTTASMLWFAVTGCGSDDDSGGDGGGSDASYADVLVSYATVLPEGDTYVVETNGGGSFTGLTLGDGVDDDLVDADLVLVAYDTETAEILGMTEVPDRAYLWNNRREPGVEYLPATISALSDDEITVQSELTDNEITAPLEGNEIFTDGLFRDILEWRADSGDAITFVYDTEDDDAALVYVTAANL